VKATGKGALGQSVANLTSLIVVSNALAPIVTTDVRYLPSGILGRPSIHDVCREAPSPSRDGRLSSSAQWLFMWTDYDPRHEANKPYLQLSNVPTNSSMFLCAGCRELVQFFDIRLIDHSLPWWDKYAERPTKHQTNAWFQCRGPQKANPRRLSRQG
jgi:hypothetical protein